MALPAALMAIEPIDHRPTAELVAAIKAAGQERIAQGLQGILAKDGKTGELFTARSPLMVTTNKTTAEWTVSVINDKVVGTTLLIGTGLQRTTPDEIPALPTFDRTKAEPVIAALKAKGYGASYYPDERQRLAKDYGHDRIFTGQVTLTTDREINGAMKPVFADVLVMRGNGEFCVLVVDQSGACATIAFGGTFSEKP